MGQTPSAETSEERPTRTVPIHRYPLTEAQEDWAEDGEGRGTYTVPDIPPPDDPDSLVLFAKTLTGETLELPCRTTSRIWALYILVEERTGVCRHRIRLIANGQQMSNSSRTVSDYGLQHGVIIHVVFRLRGGRDTLSPLLSHGLVTLVPSPGYEHTCEYDNAPSDVLTSPPDDRLHSWNPTEPITITFHPSTLRLWGSQYDSTSATYPSVKNRTCSRFGPDPPALRLLDDPRAYVHYADPQFSYSHYSSQYRGKGWCLYVLEIEGDAETIRTRLSEGVGVGGGFRVLGHSFETSDGSDGLTYVPELTPPRRVRIDSASSDPLKVSELHFRRLNIFDHTTFFQLDSPDDLDDVTITLLPSGGSWSPNTVHAIVVTDCCMCGWDFVFTTRGEDRDDEVEFLVEATGIGISEDGESVRMPNWIRND